MILKYFTVIVLLLALKINAQEQSNYPKFDPNRNPFDDLKSTIQIAQQTNKRIILDVGGEWCIWCHRIDAFMHGTEEIKTLLEENYIILKINFSKENKNEKFLSQFPAIDGYPHFFVLEKTEHCFIHKTRVS